MRQYFNEQVSSSTISHSTNRDYSNDSGLLYLNRLLFIYVLFFEFGDIADSIWDDHNFSRINLSSKYYVVSRGFRNCDYVITKLQKQLRHSVEMNIRDASKTVQRVLG